MHNDSLYLSAHSYCDNGKKYVKKGVLAKLDKNFQASMVFDKFEQPHSIDSYENKIFICSPCLASLIQQAARHAITSFQGGLCIAGHIHTKPSVGQHIRHIGAGFVVVINDENLRNCHFSHVPFLSMPAKS